MTKRANRRKKKKRGCGCFTVIFLFFLLIAAGGISLYAYQDYLSWQTQKEEFNHMMQAGSEIISQSTDKDSAKNCLTTLIAQTKKGSKLSNLSAEITYNHGTAAWTSGNQITLSFRGKLYTKNPFLDTDVAEKTNVTLVCGAKKLTMIPTTITQTGIKGDYTNYEYFYDKWHDGTNQRAIADQWNLNGRTQMDDIATLNNYYLVAVRPIFGNCGDVLCVVLEDGTYFDCIIADEKGDDAGNDWGHVKSSAISLVEFEVIGNKENDQAPSFVTPAKWEGKKVSAIINKGTAEQIKSHLVSQ